VCVYAFSLYQKSSDMIVKNKPLIYEMILSHTASNFHLLCDSPLLWPCSRSMSPGHQQPWCRPNTDQQPGQWPTVATPSESACRRPTAGRWPGGAATRPRSSRTSLPLLTRTSAKPPPNTSTSQGKNLLFPVACLGEATCVRLLFYCSNWLDYCFSVQPCMSYCVSPSNKVLLFVFMCCCFSDV
jgi:hypothetical protein